MKAILPLLPLAAPTAAGDIAKLRKAATEFEAMAIGQFLAPMFETTDTAHTLFGGGDAEATWKPLLVAELGKHIAAHGGLGLAAPVLAAMIRMQESKSPDPRSVSPSPTTSSPPPGGWRIP